MTEELAKAIAELVNLKEEEAAIFAELKALHPEEYARIDELRVEAEQTRTKVEDLLRKGRSTVDLLGRKFDVKVPTSTKVDVGSLVSRATERGDIKQLVEYGLLYYEARADQMERLPGELRAVYGEYLQKVEMTPRVTLPKDLK